MTCPECNEKLEHIDYVEYGRMYYEDGQWVEKEWHSERLYRCPHCDVELTYDELVEMNLL